MCNQSLQCPAVRPQALSSSHLCLDTSTLRVCHSHISLDHRQLNTGPLVIKRHWCVVCSVALPQSPGWDWNFCHPVEQHGW